MELKGCYRALDSPITWITLAGIVGGGASISLGLESLPWGLFPITLGLPVVVVCTFFLIITSLSTMFARSNAEMMTEIMTTSLSNMPRMDKEGIANLLMQLEQVGFYKYTEPWIVDHIKALAMEEGTIYPMGSRRFYFESEDSTEFVESGRADIFLAELNPLLELRGVAIHTVEQDYVRGGGYNITVNGTKYVLCDAQEAEAQQNVDELVKVRALKMINSLLETVGAEDRLYRIHGGGYSVAFLTPTMYQLIQESSAISKRYKPKKINEETN